MSALMFLRLIVMRIYKLNFGWEIGFPENWEHEVDKNGDYVFYLPNDSTTVHAVVFHSDRQGVPAPAAILEDYFVELLTPYNAEEIPLGVDGLGCRAFYCVTDKGIYRIGVGIFTKGTLLSLDVYSENEDKVFEVAELFFCKARFNGG